jgi:ribosomal protein L11 methylase PrmA
MKMAFVVYVEHARERVMKLLTAAGIDYYTRWDQAKGKGHGTEPHLGTGGYPSTNSVLMIAFEQEAALEHLIKGIVAANAEIKRSSDHIRLFQLPLDRIV